jgi:uncharacterized protein (DUF433 family)
MNWEEKIISDPEIMVGKPVVRGTRLTVEFILDRFADGWTEKMILENYPNLTQDDLRAIFAYAADCMKDGIVFRMPASQT